MVSTPLSKLVNTYKEEYFELFEEQLERYKSIKDYDELIYHSVFELGPDFKALTHNNILRFNIANNLYGSLINTQVKENISNCSCFTDILDIIYDIRKSNIFRYFGPLNLYDCSLRIGSHFNLYPKKVHIHCGSINGAKNLFKSRYNDVVQYFNEDKSFPYIYVHDFPPELQNLEPHHIENFLCKFATNLEQMKS